MQMPAVTCSVFTRPFLSHLLPISSTSELCLASDLQQQHRLLVQFSNQQPDHRVPVAQGSLPQPSGLPHHSKSEAVITNQGGSCCYLRGRGLTLLRSGEEFERNTDGEEVGSLSLTRFPFLYPKVRGFVPFREDNVVPFNLGLVLDQPS